jgi:hypothetical protein
VTDSNQYPFGKPTEPSQAPPGHTPRREVPPPSPGQPMPAPYASVQGGPPTQPVGGRVQQPVTLFGGSDGYHTPQNLPPGVANQIINWMPTDRGLIPRLGYSAIYPSTYSNMIASLILPRSEVDGTPSIVVAGLRSTSTTSAGNIIMQSVNQRWDPVVKGVSASTFSTFPLDGAVIYDPANDINETVITTAWTIPVEAGGFGNAGVFSYITNGPMSAAVAYFDTRLVFGACGSSGITVPQRVVWSARGDPATYTAPDGGLQDLVDMRGGITKIVTDQQRMVIFSNYQLWQAVPAPFPFGFQFGLMDSSIGCSDPRTIVQTPEGFMFLGTDMNVYLLPTGAVKAQPVGTPVWELLKQSHAMTTPPGPYFASAFNATFLNGSCFACYDNSHAEYRLFVPANPTTEAAGTSLALNLLTNQWSQRSFKDSFTAVAYVPQAATSITQIDPAGPAVYLTSSKSAFRQLRSWLTGAGPFTSGDTQDDGSAFSAFALFPIANPNPNEKLTVRALNLDYSTNSMPSGASVSVAFSSDFGQTYNANVINLALPYQQYSGNTMVPVNWPAATYPSIEFRYTSQVSGNLLALQRAQAVVEGVGLGWP